MAKDLNEALENTDTVYQTVAGLVEEITWPIFWNVNATMWEINNNIENLTLDDLRNYINKLQISAWSISEIKEKSWMKWDISTTIKEEAYATSFNWQTGSVAAKENSALLEISNEVLAEKVYKLASNLIKTKTDQILRMIDTLKTILTSKLSEMKIANLNKEAF